MASDILDDLGLSTARRRVNTEQKHIPKEATEYEKVYEMTIAILYSVRWKDGGEIEFLGRYQG